VFYSGTHTVYKGHFTVTAYSGTRTVVREIVCVRILCVCVLLLLCVYSYSGTRDCVRAYQRVRAMRLGRPAPSYMEPGAHAMRVSPEQRSGLNAGSRIWRFRVRDPLGSDTPGGALVVWP
jgi:hypothetical protein